MALFRKKKREELPAEEFTLPEPPELLKPPHMEMEEEGEELPELPELPPLEKGYGERIKKEFEIPSVRGGILEEDLPPIPPSSAVPSITPRARRFVSPVERPIFVKIDKFKDSIEHLSRIRESLRSASSILQKIKEIRQQEDHELHSWERDLESIKEKLENIDKKLFSDTE